MVETLSSNLKNFENKIKISCFGIWNEPYYFKTLPSMTNRWRDLFIGNSTDSRYSPEFQSDSDGKVTRRAISIRCVDKGILWKRLLFTREQRSPFVLHSFSEHCNPMEGNEYLIECPLLLLEFLRHLPICSALERKIMSLRHSNTRRT